MSVLANIDIGEADLLKVRPDIGDYLQFENQTLDDVILTAKRSLYREIKAHEQAIFPGLSEAEINTRLASVRDYENEQALKDRLVFMAVAELMAMNGLAEQYEMYAAKARKIPLHYWIDIDADSEVDNSEKRSKRVVTFGR